MASGACRPSSSSTTTSPGVRIKHDPDYMHTFADRHPQFVLEDVRVPASAILGDDRRGRRDDQRVVRRGADPHRGSVQWRDGAPAHAGRRVGHRTGPVRRADLRLPGRVVPAGRLGRRRLRRPAHDPRVRLARGHRRGSEGHPRQGLARQAVRLRGGLPLCGPRRPGLRWPRLHARVSRPSGSSASSGSTGSGKAPPRSSASSWLARSRSAASAGSWDDRARSSRPRRSLDRPATRCSRRGPWRSSAPRRGPGSPRPSATTCG